MRRLLCLAAVLPFVVACSDERGPVAERIAQQQDAIINGIPDSTHDAVVALFGNFSACSGTVFTTNASGVYVITAAHCFEQDTMSQVVIGDDYQAAEDILNVVAWEQHPQWDSDNLAYDFALIRASGSFSHPVIPVLTPGEDAIGPGTPLTHVGYGLLSSPNGDTTSRHYGTGNVSEVAQIQFAYNQPTLGPCSGDSGGASLVDLGAGERVAGVISFGDQECTDYGVSGRVSSVYDWIVAFTGGDPGPTTTTTTATTTTGPGPGAGGGMPTGPGAGGSGADGTNWVAGDLDRDKPKGTIITSCASTPAPTGNLAALGLMAAGLAFAVARRRR
jgi:MYXO-CTERM domain-containing protein